MRKHPVHPGELTERITLHRRTLTDDGAGGATEVLTQYAAVWAHVRPLSGDERQAAGRTGASRSYLIVLRRLGDVREKDIARWGGRDLNIRFIRGRGARELYLELEAEAGVPA